MADLWILITKKSSTYALGLQQGDILGAFPVDYPFNKCELAQYIIIPITGMSLGDMAVLSCPLWSTGVDSIIDRTTTPPTLTGKRKHQVRFTQIAPLISGWDAAAASSNNIIYQPFLDRTIIVAPKSVNFIRNKFTNTYRRSFT